MSTSPSQGPQFQPTFHVEHEGTLAKAETHWAVITWRGTHDLADTEFCELLSGGDEASARYLAHLWAHGNLAEGTRYKVDYMGNGGYADIRENDPRKNIPLSTGHATTPRQQICVSRAKHQLGADGVHADGQGWFAVKG